MHFKIRGLKFSRNENKYMHVKKKGDNSMVRIQGTEIRKLKEFKYLEATA